MFSYFSASLFRVQTIQPFFSSKCPLCNARLSMDTDIQVEAYWTALPRRKRKVTPVLTDSHVDRTDNKQKKWPLKTQKFFWLWLEVQSPHTRNSKT